jgi:uncharacterized protein YbcI
MKRSLVIKKLESFLSKRIKDIYEARLKQQLNTITYQLFEKTLVIVMDGSVTQVEQFLNENERQELAKQVRDTINNIVSPQIKITIEEVMEVNVIDFLFDTTIDSTHTAAIAKRRQCLIATFELRTKSSLDNC